MATAARKDDHLVRGSGRLNQEAPDRRREKGDSSVSGQGLALVMA